MDKSGTFVRNHSKGYLNPIGAKAITWPQIKNAIYFIQYDDSHNKGENTTDLII